MLGTWYGYVGTRFLWS